MTEKQAEFLKDACDFAGVDAEIDDEYSGRGMYGRQTHGIVTTSALDVLVAVITYIQSRGATAELEEIGELSRLSQDSMGKSDVIIY